MRHWELRDRRGGIGFSPSPSAALRHRGRAGAARYLLRLCWMVSRSFVTVRLLPATCRGTYSVCDALRGESREAVRPQRWTKPSWVKRGWGEEGGRNYF